MEGKGLEKLLNQIYYIAINGEIVYQSIPLGVSDMEFIASRKETGSHETVYC